MGHSLHAVGFAFRLRPVTCGDAAQIVELRTADLARTRFLNRIPSDVEKQREWLAAYERRSDEYYWAIERRNGDGLEGFVSVYNLDRPSRRAEWGRWVLRAGSMAAVESALLVYRTAFEMLELAEVYCVTVAANASVVSFHDSCGVVRAGVRTGAFLAEEGPLDCVVHRCRRADFPGVVARLEPQARMIQCRFFPRS